MTSENVGLAAAPPPSAATSPTYSLVNENPGGRLVVWHVDLYRVAPHEVDDLALEDLMDDAVMAVEWPDRWHRAPAEAIRVTLEVVGDQERRITIAK